MQKCYSANDEDFNYNTAGEVFYYLDSEGDLVVGRIYYEADCCRMEPSDLIRAYQVIEQIGESMWDEIGETADTYPDVSKEAEAELQSLLNEWVLKHADPSNYWRVVGKSRPMMVTEQDIADFNRPAADHKGAQS